MLFVKDVLRTGSYKVGDEVVEVTDDRMNRWIENFNEMQGMNRAIPVPWEHTDPLDEEGFPVNKSDSDAFEKRKRSKYNAGWMNRLWTEQDKDAEGNPAIDGNGKPILVLKTELDIPDETDSEKLKTVGSYLSPQFGSWTDGDKKWTDAISHMAITPRPRSANQSRKFTPVDGGNVEKLIAFSLEDRIENQQSKQAASAQEIEQSIAKRIISAISGAFQFSNESTPNTSATDDGDGSVSQEQAKNDTQQNSAKLIQALQAMGISISGSSEISGDPEVVAELVQMIASSIARRERQKKESENQGGTMTDAVTVSMSNEAGDNASQSGNSNQSVESAEQMRQLSLANDRLLKEATEGRKSRYREQINRYLSEGRCSKERADKLVAAVDQYQFSVDDDGANSRIDIELELISENQPGSVWSDEEKIRQFSIQEDKIGETPFFNGGDISDEEADRLANAELGYTPRQQQSA